jgi:glycine/D-amino acid oxidase-like deaminating enzyme
VSRAVATALVVGGGINGLATAWWLARDGWAVTVIDRGPLPNPAAASHGRHRLIQPHSDGDPAPARRALALWRAVFDDLGDGADGLFVATGTLAPARAVVPAGAEALSPDEAGRRWPAFAGLAVDRLVHHAEFGALLADRILARLVDRLPSRGVTLRPGIQAVVVDPKAATVTTADGDRLSADIVVLAPGTGTPGLMAGLDLPAPARPPRAVRSHVVYLDGGGFPEAEGRPTPCWVGFGDDLWGMPPIAGLPAKLGCGAFSTPTDDPDAPPAIDAEAILDVYRRAFPGFGPLAEGRLGFNHWLSTGRPRRGVLRQGRVLLISADDGQGFKHAPATGRDAATLAGRDDAEGFHPTPLAEAGAPVA